MRAKLTALSNNGRTRTKTMIGECFLPVEGKSFTITNDEPLDPSGDYTNRAIITSRVVELKDQSTEFCPRVFLLKTENSQYLVEEILG